MISLPRWLSRLLLGNRRLRGERAAICQDANLELDVVEVSGTARDLGKGGVFLAISAPIACGVRGHLSRGSSRERIPVRVSWRRTASRGHCAGLGLSFE